MNLVKTTASFVGKEKELFREISEGTYRKVFQHLQGLRKDYPGINERTLLMFALCNLVEHKAAKLPEDI